MIYCFCWWDLGKDKYVENFEKENFKLLFLDKYVVNKYFRLAFMYNLRLIKEFEYRVFSMNGYGYKNYINLEIYCFIYF